MTGAGKENATFVAVVSGRSPYTTVCVLVLWLHGGKRKINRVDTHIDGSLMLCEASLGRVKSSWHFLNGQREGGKERQWDGVRERI